MTLACRIQQASDGALDFVVLAFAGVAEDDVTVLVNDVLGRPVLIAPASTSPGSLHRWCSTSRYARSTRGARLASFEGDG